MNLNDYQELSTRTMPKQPYQKRDLANYCMGLSGESGELVDLLKKHIFHGHELDREAARYELGDILHYWSGLCKMLGFTTEEVAEANIQKLMRRYPDGFSTADSVKRVDVNG